MPHNITIRQAETGDVSDIAQLLDIYASKNLLLNRNKDNIYQHLQEFIVAEYDGKLVGTSALHIYGSNLGEIRSLAVHPDFQGNHIGQMLVQACEKLAYGLHVAQLFALTYVDGFFTRMGYSVVAKETLPHKIWTVCVHCKKFGDCDEVAVQKRLSDASIEPMNIIPILTAQDVK